MRINWFIGLCLVGLGFGAHPAVAQQLFTNLNFESAAFPSMLPAGTPVPASQALPGWNATPNSVYRNLWLPRGPFISVADISLGGGGWVGAQGNFYVSMKAGVSAPVSISQTGYLSPTIRSLRFRVWANLTDFTVSFAGQVLPCAIVSSNQYNVCEADVSRFAGTTGELKFIVSKAGAMDSPLVTLDDISFVTEPGSSTTGTRVSIVKSGKTGLQLSFAVRTGTTYSVQSTTDLSNWKTVATFEATNSLMLYSDGLIVTNYPTSVFYRVIGPAP